MRTSLPAVFLAATVALSGCALGSHSHDDTGAELTNGTLVTQADGYLMVGFDKPHFDRDYWRKWLASTDKFIWMPPKEGMKRFYGCVTPQPISVLEKYPDLWQLYMKADDDFERVPGRWDYSCPPPFYMAFLPKGTEIRIETVNWFWGMDNGTVYFIYGHLVDQRISDSEIVLGTSYFVTPLGSPDGKFHLKPEYFSRSGH